MPKPHTSGQGSDGVTIRMCRRLELLIGNARRAGGPETVALLRSNLDNGSLSELHRLGAWPGDQAHFLSRIVGAVGANIVCITGILTSIRIPITTVKAITAAINTGSRYRPSGFCAALCFLKESER